jgi:hypothetical protein
MQGEIDVLSLTAFRRRPRTERALLFFVLEVSIFLCNKLIVDR